MKAFAAIAIIGLASASEDNEFFKFNNTKIDFPHHNRNSTVRPHPIHAIHPIHQNKTHNATVRPKPIRKVHPILFNRTQPIHPNKPHTNVAPTKIPTLKAFDDEELFLADEIPSNELHQKGIGKWADRNKEWLAPVGHKVLDKLLSSFDDEELFSADINDDELAGFFGKVGSFVGKNKNVIVPMATKLMGKFDSENDFELHSTASTLASQNKNIVSSIFNKLVGKLDDEFTGDELAFLGSINRVLQKNGPTVARIGVKALPLLAFEDIEEEELFNLDAFLNDAVRTYNDARQNPRNYGSLVNDGIQIYKDIKQRDDEDEELFNLDAFLNDAIKTYNDARVQPRNYGNLVNDGIQLVKDIKQKKQDDEELFNLGGLIKDGLNIYGDIKNKNYGGLVNDGIQTVKDIKRHHDDEELFNLGGLINDGVNIYGDIKNKNYGDLVNHGLQTVNDIKQANHGKKFLRH